MEVYKALGSLFTSLRVIECSTHTAQVQRRPERVRDKVERSKGGSLCTESSLDLRYPSDRGGGRHHGVPTSFASPAPRGFLRGACSIKQLDAHTDADAVA